MKRPPNGLCLPCTVTRVIDGDTVEISVRSERRYKIRLLDCWAPEKRTPEGEASTAYAEVLVAEAGETHVFIPTPRTANIFSEVMTFERVLAHVFISSTETLSQRMVEAGHATKAKP